MRKGKKENLPKHVYRKRLGVIYFERKGEPSVKFKCQNPDEPEFHMEYALYLSGKPQQEMKHSRSRDMASLIESYVQVHVIVILKRQLLKITMGFWISKTILDILTK